MSWEIASLLVLGAALAAGFGWYERSRPPAKVVALVAAMVALAVLGRIAFAAVPNVKPTTDLVLLTGYALGGAPGFCAGAATALVSNLFFTHGPWTPWQMAAWGGVGVAGAGLARATRGAELGRVWLAAACGVAGLAFGAVMDLYLWTLAGEQTPGAYLAISASSLPFNLAHVAANVGFCLLIGPPLVRALRRYARRLEVRWPAPSAATGAARTAGRAAGAAPLAAAVAVLAVAASLALPAGASAGSGAAVSYLERAQNGDGGFGDAPRDSSSQLYTGWAALGLLAADVNPRDVISGRRSVIDFIRRHAGSLHDTGDLSRTILVLEASGLSARSFSGRDLVGELRSRRRRDGSYPDGARGAGLVNQTAFAILALRAAGAGGVGRSARWIAERQNRDGGFGFDASTSSPDVTGAALQALAAAGRGDGKAARRAVRYLRGAQNRDGGFGNLNGGASNTQSAAWAVQGLAAASGGGRTARAALGYIRSLQRGDGSVLYARGNAQTPVWVTGQALLGLERQPFPIPPVARMPGAGGGGARGGPAGGGGTAGPAAGGGGASREGAGGSASGGGGPAKGGDGRRRGDRPAGGARSGGGPSLGALRAPADAGEGGTAAPSEDGGGSVLGGIVAAASSAAFVVGTRRMLRKRLAAAEAAGAGEAAT